ncbi:MAG TPA: 3'-5' exonuclease [Deltaproteobacteria bacterium]|nr:3'-5' exonuclease [Deltaproteobacteria bacterium]
MKWKSLPIVAFDTETTGLEPFGGDRIIEFAAVEFRLDEAGEIVDRTDHAWLINPERDIPRKVTEITGISADDVNDAPRFINVAPKIRKLLANAVTVAHNYPFDLAFLMREFDEVQRQTHDAHMCWPEPLAEVDTVDLSMRCFPDARSHRLSDVAERLNVELERAHRATDDAAACGLCFIQLARRHEVEDDLQAMLDWSNAIGRPPEEGPIGPDATGRVVFLEGRYEGEAVSEHPVYLGWMLKARVRTDSGWRWRYPEGVRRWVRRWLDVRGAGRARQNPKSFHAQDWVLDPCIALPRQGTSI